MEGKKGDKDAEKQNEPKRNREVSEGWTEDTATSTSLATFETTQRRKEKDSKEPSQLSGRGDSANQPPGGILSRRLARRREEEERRKAGEEQTGKAQRDKHGRRATKKKEVIAASANAMKKSTGSRLSGKNPVESSSSVPGSAHQAFIDDGEEEEDILTIIPDLDEQKEEPVELARAPEPIRPVQGISELDNDLTSTALPELESVKKINSQLPQHGKMNLSVIIDRLVPRDQLEDKDETMEFEELLEEVSQQLNQWKQQQVTTTSQL